MSQREKDTGEHLVFDPKEIKKGTCHVKKWKRRKVSICRDDDDKIKIYEVNKEE